MLLQGPRPVVSVVIIFLAFMLTAAAQSVAAQATPGAVQPSATPASPGATPTVDRLAPPPTVENPTQADEGAYLYWQNCQPCHGDRGQGLTDDWREQYPPEDQNCWNSGCHGNVPYENGFTLPTTVPPVTGPQSLQNFEHVGALLAYMHAAMPYNAPGSLDEEEYLAIAAFLAREHGVWDGEPLNRDTAETLRLRPAERATPTAAAVAAAMSGARAPARAEEPASRSSPGWQLVVLLPVIVALVVAGLWRWRRRD